MNIAIAFHDNDIYSGATRSMLSLAESWHAEGNNVLAIIPKGGQLKQLIEDKNIAVIEIPHFKTRLNMSRGLVYRIITKTYGIISQLLLTVYSFLILSPIIRKGKIDILYSNTSATMIGYILKKLTNIPLVWHIREFGVEDQNCEFVMGRKNLCKRISTADLVVFISESVKNAYISEINNKNTIVAYNDISKNYDCFVERDWDKNKLTFLSVGSIIPGKGHKCVIDAIIQLHEEGYPICLNIAGKGKAYMEELSAYVHNKKAESYIHLLGQVNDMKTLREECEVGVVASLMEAFGRVTVEGMLSGLLMIGANSGGTAELINNGDNGLLFEPDNVDSLKDTIKEVFSNRSRAKEIAEKGYLSAKRFTEGNCAQYIMSNMRCIRMQKEEQ